MKKQFILFIAVFFTLAMVSSAYAIPKPRSKKTKSVPSKIAKLDKTAKANKANGKKIYMITAKPMACKMCHGVKGNGRGKLGIPLKPAPRDFTNKATMKKVSAGQMFWGIKNGSKGTGMVAHGKPLKDKLIWDVVKYIREDLALLKK